MRRQTKIADGEFNSFGGQGVEPEGQNSHELSFGTNSKREG